MKLQQAGIVTARLDSLVLLEDVTGKNRAWLLAHPEYILTDLRQKKLEAHVARRWVHEPLAYIRGKTEFYGREFLVSKGTLEPRPESETMINLALQVLGSRLKALASPTVLDVGTGSGALAVTLKLECPKLSIAATEISKPALKIAKQNAKKLSADIHFYQGNLLEAIYNLTPKTYNLILANLPYVPDNHTINQAAMQEPKIAIFGGPDGLALYRELFIQIDKLKSKPRYILTESLPPQHKNLAGIAKRHGYHQQNQDDFIQVFTTG